MKKIKLHLNYENLLKITNSVSNLWTSQANSAKIFSWARFIWGIRHSCKVGRRKKHEELAWMTLSNGFWSKKEPCTVWSTVCSHSYAICCRYTFLKFRCHVLRCRLRVQLTYKQLFQKFNRSKKPQQRSHRINLHFQNPLHLIWTFRAFSGHKVEFQLRFGVCVKIRQGLPSSCVKKSKK